MDSLFGIDSVNHKFEIKYFIEEDVRNFFYFILIIIFISGCGGVDKKIKDSSVSLSQKKDPLNPKNIKNNSELGLDNGYKEYFFSNSAGGKRKFYLILPSNYDDNKKYRLLLVYSGTDQSAEAMHIWFGKGFTTDPNIAPGFERTLSDTIFVYPQAVYRDVKGRLGWRLGPYSQDGNEGNVDIQFTKELLTLIKSEYSINNDSIFVTGHSWGGDMASVVGCFLGSEFKAVIPAGANYPHWFYDSDAKEYKKCNGKPAVWIYFGRDDEHFARQNKNTYGENGYLQKDFWVWNNGCNKNVENIILSETIEYAECELSPVRLTIYGPGQTRSSGQLKSHYPPDYFLSEISKWIQQLDGNN